VLRGTVGFERDGLSAEWQTVIEWRHKKLREISRAW